MTPRKIGGTPHPPRLLVGIWLGLSSASLFLLARRAIVDALAVLRNTSNPAQSQLRMAVAIWTDQRQNQFYGEKKADSPRANPGG
jgi:hypothetical protein